MRQQLPVHLLHLHCIEQQPAVPVVANSHRLPPPEKLHALLLGVLVLEVESGNFVLAAPIEQIHGLRAQPRAALAASIAVFPAPTTTTVPCSSRRWPVLYAAISSSAFITPSASSPGMLSRCIAPRPKPRKMKSNSFSSASSAAAESLHAATELHAQRADQLHLTQAVGGAQFVFGHAIGIQSARQRAALDDGGPRALPAQLRRAGQRCRTAANACHAQAARSRRGRRRRSPDA